MTLSLEAQQATEMLHILAAGPRQKLDEFGDSLGQVLKDILAHGADVKAAPSDRFGLDGFPPLLMAAFHGHTEVVDAVLDAPAVDVQQISRLNGATALVLAAYGGHLEVVTRLLKAGAHVDTADARGDPPVTLARTSFRAELLIRRMRNPRKPQWGNNVRVCSECALTGGGRSVGWCCPFGDPAPPVGGWRELALPTG